MKQSSLVLLAVLTLSVSCSKVKDAENNMKSMKDTTTEMSKTTEKMEENTTVMYQQVRSKEAEDTRNKKFEILNDKEADFGTRIAAAAVYFKSFEFQLWTGSGEDTQHVREVLMLDAANEFTRRVCDTYKKINVKRLSPVKEGKGQADEHTFYALAATMHMTHHFQDGLVEKKPRVKKTSFYDIVKSALRKDDLGEPMADYEEVLVSGINKEIMTELIKARVDMLSALALKDLTDKRNMTIGQKLKGLLFKVTAGNLGSIDLPETYPGANDATKNRVITYLDGALKARNFLGEIDVKKDLEKTIKSAFQKISLSVENRDREHNDDQPDTEPQTTQEQEAVDAHRNQTKKLIDDLLI